MNTRIDSNQKIIPYLWFPRQAEEAANFYVATFSAIGGSGNGGGQSTVGHIARYGEAASEVSGIPEGTAMTIEFQLAGQDFIALNGGPEFSFTPAISFFVSCKTAAQVDQLWQVFSEGGETLMPLDAYPFSEKFGWLNDKFGVSWQLVVAPSSQPIIPFLMFVGEQHGKAEEAINFYTSLFDNAGITSLQRYGPGQGEPEGTLMPSQFKLAGQDFMAMDSALEHNFTFTEATSFFVNCESQDEVDELWKKFTAEGEEGPCGWLKDRYGVSWQIIPTVLMEMLSDEDAARAERVAQAMLQMKKINVAELEAAYNN